MYFSVPLSARSVSFALSLLFLSNNGEGGPQSKSGAVLSDAHAAGQPACAEWRVWVCLHVCARVLLRGGGAGGGWVLRGTCVELAQKLKI